MAPLLEVKELEVVIKRKDRSVYAVNNVSFVVRQGETVGLVGESGSGKSMTCRSILNLLPRPHCQTKGSILFEGEDLLAMPERKLQQVRGKRIGMIMQDTMSSLDPVYRVGDQIVETLRTHQQIGKKAAWARAVELLRQVGIPSPEKRVWQYPHELSGGMRQRVMIAMAISCMPRLLLADEPTTALDVTVQDQVLRLLQRLKREMGMGILLVTHNLGIVAEMCDRVVVLYAGKVMEIASVEKIFASPRNMYTKGLIRSVPQLDVTGRLEGIPGSLPVMTQPVVGCPFRERCPLATEDCARDEKTRLIEVSPGHWSSCIHHERVCRS